VSVLDKLNKHKQLVHHCGWSARQLCNIAYNPDVKVLDDGNMDLVYASPMFLYCIILLTGIQLLATIVNLSRRYHSFRCAHRRLTLSL